MALTPRQLDLFVQPIIDVYTNLENELFTLIVSRLKTKKNINSDNVLVWQIEKLNQVHALDQQMLNKISKASGVSAKKLFSIVKDAGYSDLKQVDNYFSKLAEAGAALPLVSDGQTIVDKVMRSYFKLAQSNYNRVNQTMLSQARQIYSDIIHETTQSVLAGLKTHRLDLSQYLGHILVETAKTFSLFLNLQTPVELSNESNYGFDYDYKILQCS